jgi:hypothetical protein
MVVTLISNDNIAVEFGKDEVPRIPYITDIIDCVDETMETDHTIDGGGCGYKITDKTVKDIEIPIIGISGKALKIIKELLELQTQVGVPYRCSPIETRKLGVIIKTSPIHILDPWEGKMSHIRGKSEYALFFDCVTTYECVEAFHAADYLKCYDLRYGLGYIIAQRQLACDSEVNKAIKEHFSEHLMATYVNVVLNED